MHELKTFHPVGALTEQTKQNITVRLQTLTEYMEHMLDFTLGFKNATINPKTGKNQPSYGLTSLIPLANTTRFRLYVWLDYTEIIPMLRDDLEDYERMGCEWALANTLVHEMTVSNLLLQRDYADLHAARLLVC